MTDTASTRVVPEVAYESQKNPDVPRAEVAELADARDSKSREVTPHVGSIPTFGMIVGCARLQVAALGCGMACV